MIDDLTSIDHNVRAINEIEQSWGLPALPDMVKLDLATFSPDVTKTTELLHGLRSDLSQVDEQRARVEAPTPPAPGPVSSLYRAPEESTVQRVKRIYSGVAGLSQPTVLAMN